MLVREDRRVATGMLRQFGLERFAELLPVRLNLLRGHDTQKRSKGVYRLRFHGRRGQPGMVLRTSRLRIENAALNQRVPVLPEERLYSSGAGFFRSDVEVELHGRKTLPGREAPRQDRQNVHYSCRSHAY